MQSRKKSISQRDTKRSDEQRISYNFRPRKSHDTSSCAESLNKKSSVSLFNPPNTSSHTDYSSITNNHTLKKAESFCTSLIDQEQSSASASAQNTYNRHSNDTTMQINNEKSSK